MAIANHPQHQLCAAADTVSPPCGFNIFMHGVAAQSENLPDLPIALSLGDERNAFDLARAEGNGRWWGCPLGQEGMRTIIGDRAQQPSSQDRFCVERIIARPRSRKDRFGFPRHADWQAIARYEIMIPCPFQNGALPRGELENITNTVPG